MTTEQLIEDYKRRLESTEIIMTAIKGSDTLRWDNLNIKASCYREFIGVLEREVDKEEADNKMFREFIMRNGFTFPENEEDLKWSDEGENGVKPGYFFKWIHNKLGLGKLDEEI